VTSAVGVNDGSGGPSMAKAVQGRVAHDAPDLGAPGARDE